jgi:hypothetical protein
MVDLIKDALKSIDINDGALLGRRDSDYTAGVLPYQIRLLDGNWTPYIPQGEKQYNKAADSMSCVSFSATSIIETQEKFLTGSSPNYSDRWVAKVSNTTLSGNFLWQVADSIQNFGLVWEEHYPAPTPPWSFEEWMSDIAPEKFATLKQVGQEWKRWWTISYEWVDLTHPENLLIALRQCPVQMIIPGHAVEAIYKPADIVTYFDTYEPYIKGRPVSDFASALKIILNPLKGQRMSNAILVKRGNEYGWFLPDVNPSALISHGLNFGTDIPKNPDGSVNFAEVDKLVRGSVTTW